MHKSGEGKMTDEDKVKQLTQKLKDKGDITLKEADWIYSLLKRGSQVLVLRGKPRPDPKLPIAALTDWFQMVNNKLERGERGNFIFSIFLYENSYIINCLRPVMDKEYWNFEDRIRAIWANERMHYLFPIFFKKLFKWSEEYQLYKLSMDRVGFCYYPLYDIENNQVYTISQVLKELSLFPAITARDEMPEIPLFSRASVTKYILEYLRKNIPCMEIFSDEIVVFTDKENVPIAVAAKNVSFDDLLENALRKNDKRITKELLSRGGYMERFPDKKFTTASVNYIENIVRARLEQKAIREAVKNENFWLEEIR